MIVGSIRRAVRCSPPLHSGAATPSPFNLVRLVLLLNDTLTKQTGRDRFKPNKVLQNNNNGNLTDAIKVFLNPLRISRGARC